MPLQNDLILRAAKGEVTERPPVWLMRQAGRILKEYRAVREKAGSFRNLVETPEMAAEVTVQPVDILDVDAAIIFSDILVVCDLLGFPYGMAPGKGPVFEKTLAPGVELDDWEEIDVEGRLDYVFEAIRITKEKLSGRVPLIGFAGAPWTLFCYLTEGEGSRTFTKARKLLYTCPEFCHEVLDRIADMTVRYLKGQVEAGANMVQVFDSWAGILGEEMYRKFALPPIRKICEAIDEVPVTVFSKGAHGNLHDLAKLDCRTIGLDWTMNIEESIRTIGPEKTLQGNLDPALLYADKARVKEEAARMLDRFAGHPYIANLGHGVYPDTNPEKVKAFVQTVKTHHLQDQAL